MILKGDEAAFEVLYEKTQARLRRVAMGFLGDDTLVEDVVQETYARALPKLQEFRFESSLCTWFTRFTINLCLQTLTQRKKMLLTETNDIEVLMNHEPGRLTPELRRVLDDEIAGLDKLSRDILVAKDIQGLSFVEVAKKFKMPPGSVMSRLARTRLKLREALHSRAALYKGVLENR